MTATDFAGHADHFRIVGKYLRGRFPGFMAGFNLLKIIVVILFFLLRI